MTLLVSLLLAGAACPRSPVGTPVVPSASVAEPVVDDRPLLCPDLEI